MRKIIFLLSFVSALALGTSNSVWAQTPDGETPAMETACNEETGAAFGLCNAYCEAMDCEDEINAQASLNACGKVAANFSKITSRDVNETCLLVPVCRPSNECIGCDDASGEKDICMCELNPTLPECEVDDGTD